MIACITVLVGKGAVEILQVHAVHPERVCSCQVLC